MQFELVKRIVKNIQDTIFNTGKMVVESLKAHTFPTSVVNFPKVQKINGIVSVSNQKRVEKELKSSTTVQKSILKLIKGVKFPTSIKVENFPSFPKQQPFPKEMKITNFPKQKEYPKNIRVTNQPTKELKDVKEALQMVQEALKGLKLDPTINVESPKAEKVVVPAPNVTVTQQEIDYEKLASLIPVPSEIDYKKLSSAIAKEIAGMVVSIGGGGGSRKEGQDDITREYNVSDKDDSGTTKYFGFVGRSGNWYILREDTTTNQYRYIKGNKDYTTNWTGRAGLSYGLYNEVF